MKKSGFKRKTGFSNRKGINAKSGLSKTKRKRNALKQSKRKTSNPRQLEIAKCDRAFSQLVRVVAADNGGVCKCYTCSYKGLWKRGGIECGHYRSRSHMAIRWSLDNARCQCTHCNQILGGNLKVYRERLVAECGETFVTELEERSKEVTNLSETDIRTIRLRIEHKVKEVRLKKGI